MANVLISAISLFAATIIGVVIGFFFKALPHKWNDTILGFCAGMMLAASTIGLIVPAFEQSAHGWTVVIGVMVGALFLNMLDCFTPHLHSITGLDKEEHKHNKQLNHVLLFVMAVALHKLPEGIAAGVSMCSADGSTNWGVTFGIALQNIPEGMVVIAPLLLAGVPAIRTFIISIAIGVLEIVGTFIGFGMGTATAALLPMMLGFAGGAMLYVTSDEMIPETHAHGFQKQATYALLLGFVTFVYFGQLFD